MRIAERRGNVSAADESRCRQSMTPEPLTVSDFESLGNVLNRFAGKDAMNLEQLDGFLAAIVCHPAEIPKGEYLPEIWGDEMINEHTFAAQPILQGFLSLVARHKDAVAHTLQSGDIFTPILLANADGAFVPTIGQMASFGEWN
jgi:yecA family protein